MNRLASRQLWGEQVPKRPIREQPAPHHLPVAATRREHIEINGFSPCATR